jgi:nucleotide-binding universal stress UspA family protein
LSVVEPLWTSELPNSVEALKLRANETVQAAAQRLRSSGIETTAIVLCGNPKGAIVEHARRSGMDLIVVGSQRLTTARQFLHGSVARAVVRFAPCSVEVVRAEAAVGGMKILLATDGSQYSELAARSVVERPWPAGTEVRIVSVADHDMRLSAVAKRPYFEGLEKLEKEARRRAQEAVTSAEKIILEGHLATSGTIAVPSGPPKDLILKEAENWGAGLIVVGAHGQSGLTRLLIGSVSEVVAMHAPCSVEVIRCRRT